MARIVLASREVWPFVEGGGIGRSMWTAARVLAPHHEVTILTTAAHAHMRNDPRLPDGVAVEFVEDPTGDPAPMVTTDHAWSVALLHAVRALAPDVAEFNDYLGHGFATVHARRSGDPALRRTAVVVRAHTSGEMAIALNESKPVPGNAVIWAMERFAISHADALLWPGGDVLDRYRAFYGPLPRPVLAPHPVWLPALPQATDAQTPPSDGPVRMLFLNRLERRKGIIEFSEALMASSADVHLTVVGGDTLSGPGDGSMRAHLTRLTEHESRIELLSPVEHARVPALIADHHLVAVPVRWETFSHVTREALAAGRPVLATPSGAIPEVVIPGRSGWLTRDFRKAIEDLGIEEAQELGANARAALVESLPEGEHLAGVYESLGARWRPARAPARIDAIVAVCAGDASLDVTLRSLRSQRGVRVDVTLVAEPLAMPGLPALSRSGSAVLAGGGRVAMWQAGLDATTSDIVLLLPAGAELRPEFTHRALEALAEEFDYATSTVARGRRPWHAPLGGEAVAATGLDAGASVGVVRRAAFDPGAQCERELWSGLPGIVMQEPLVTRLPRRAADVAEPRNEGSPSRESVAAAFGEILTFDPAIG